MTTARSRLICPDITPYYHCVSRCVRRSYLCGYDSVSGQSYQHRRNWVEQRILYLARVYCIQICAYAVMSNHYHLVVCIDKDTATTLTSKAVIERWGMEHALPAIIQRFLSGQLHSEEERKSCNALIEIWRKRLFSLSWFMKELNYAIAVQANKEDQCTGRFWEGRFKSHALLDEKALLAAMTYVDLNPVRAGIAETPEQSKHTSFKNRLNKLNTGRLSASPLAEFIGYEHEEKPKGIPFRLSDYIELIDWIGRQFRPAKSKRIHNLQPEILNRLSWSQHQCLKLCTALEQRSRLWIGTTESLIQAKYALNRQRIVGIHIT